MRSGEPENTRPLTALGFDSVKIDGRPSATPRRSRPSVHQAFFLGDERRSRTHPPRRMARASNRSRSASTALCSILAGSNASAHAPRALVGDDDLTDYQRASGADEARGVSTCVEFAPRPLAPLARLRAMRELVITGSHSIFGLERDAPPRDPLDEQQHR